MGRLLHDILEHSDPGLPDLFSPWCPGVHNLGQEAVKVEPPETLLHLGPELGVVVDSLQVVLGGGPDHEHAPRPPRTVQLALTLVVVSSSCGSS